MNVGVVTLMPRPIAVAGPIAGPRLYPARNRDGAWWCLAIAATCLFVVPGFVITRFGDAATDDGST